MSRVETMSLPCHSTSLLAAAAKPSTIKNKKTTSNSHAAVAIATAVLGSDDNTISKTSADMTTAKAIGTYTTPKRPAGTAVVTPAENESKEQKDTTEGEKATANSAKETTATASSSPPVVVVQSASPAVPPMATVLSTSHPAIVAAKTSSKAQKNSKPSAPSIQLGPRVSPSTQLRKNPPQTAVKKDRTTSSESVTAATEVATITTSSSPSIPMKPRSLEGVLKKGVEMKKQT